MIRCTIEDLLADRRRLGRFVRSLRRGGIAVVPTDTLYGLAVDAHSPDGVAAVYRLKGRAETKPLILFASALPRLVALGITPSGPARQALATHWPGALTAIFPLVGSPLRGFAHPTLGTRVPGHAGLLRLLAAYPGFLLTTSVNRSGEEPLRDPDRIAAEFGGELAWLLDGGILPPAPASTVADFSGWPPRILRQGSVFLEDR